MHDGLGNWMLLNGKPEPIERLGDLLSQTANHRLIYEVVRVVDSVPLFINDYHQRLSNSFSLLDLSLGQSVEDMLKSVSELFRINAMDEGPVKIIFGVDQSPFYLIYIMKPHLPQKGAYKTGVKTILLHEERLNPNAKVWNEGLRARAIQELNKAGAYEAILVNRDGFLTEGSRSNLFFVNQGNLITCPDALVLPGITRKKVLEIARHAGLKIVFEAVHQQQLGNFGSAFLSGTSRKIVPIKQIGAHRFSVRNKTLEMLIEKFDAYVLNYIDEIKRGTNYHS